MPVTWFPAIETSSVGEQITPRRAAPTVSNADLAMQSSQFDLERIRRETFVQQIEFHDEIGSTNTRALELVSTTYTIPLLVLADRQTAGRGRGNHRWWAGDGGLTLSLLIDAAKLGIPASRWPNVSLATGLAVADAISSLISIADVRLKWPNDVFLNGRKVCGILLESSSHRPGLLVIGVGLNVNNSSCTAPAELKSVAISLADAGRCSFDRSNVLIAVLQKLAESLAVLSNDAREFTERWRARCYLQGRTIQVQTGQPGSDSASITGVCQGIDDEGALLLQTEAGVVRCFSGVVAKIL